MQKNSPTVSNFIKHHFRHFNAATLIDAAEGFSKHIDSGNKMMVTLAGAMSTAELGCSLAEMIRQDKVHAITTTGANLEEDLFNLVAHDLYLRIPHYRELTAEDEEALLKKRLSRVTDTCIPDEEAMKRVEGVLKKEWIKADQNGERYFPHEFLCSLLKSGEFKSLYQIDPKDSWLVAAAEKNLPIFTPGWEDSTLGNAFAAYTLTGTIKNPTMMRSGIEAMVSLCDWYKKQTKQSSIGFFQIGGGIAGDFPICVVPLLEFDVKEKGTPLWGYFCQISDSTTSYGSYSGAVPNEKITWGKLGKNTPRYVIESDATIVAPLIFASVLGW